MNIKNTILFVSMLSSAVLISACSKTAVKSSLEFQKELLAGTGTFSNTQYTWQLDSCYIDGTHFPLTTVQKSYKKTFTYDGRYSDSDLNVGKWEIETLNKLKQTIIYQPSNARDSSVYDIISINAGRLNLKVKLSNGQLGTYSFKKSN